MGEVYSGNSNEVIAAGRHTDRFDSVSVFSEDAGVPYTTPGQTLVVTLHGSGGQNYSTGRQYRAVVSGKLAYAEHTEFAFSTVRDGSPTVLRLRPNDKYGQYPSLIVRESMYLGFKNAPTANIALITERRLNAMMRWAFQNLTVVNHLKTCLTGGSMGGWGTITYGIRRADKFAALYPDRPRWRYGYTVGNHAVADYNTGIVSVASGVSPNLTPEDGGGTVFSKRHDAITYVSNAANRIPWVGWCVGRQDGYVQFSDHVDAVAALRSAKRGFAFAWNNGNHTSGSILGEITQSYPFGTFEIGKGYPLFTNHSGDQDPSVDLVGGINIGLSFRNVVESVSGFTCEVTSVLGARTVDVEPISRVFTATVTPETVSIPAANTWVTVSFSVEATIPSTDNTLFISLPSGSATNYPLQFGRAFIEGEIQDYPIMSIDGSPLAEQQADIKTRYTDGSVKFAVMSAVVPSIDTSETTLSITNGQPMSNTPATISSLLAADFDATIELDVSGVMLTGAPVSARGMLQALSDSSLLNETVTQGVDSRYWTMGPVCTTFLIHNHSSKLWDCGSNATMSIRPLFEVQWWPSLGSWKARHVVEIADVTKVKSESNLRFKFKNGYSTPVTHLDETYMLHGGQFQTRAYWHGVPPQKLNIRHNIAYLTRTKAFPNYDSSIVMEPAAIASYASNWVTKNKSLGQPGYFNKAMASTGGRPEIGMMPKWDCVALYSGDAEMLDICEKHSEFFGSNNFFWREGSNSKLIDGVSNGNGRILSKLSRPTVFWAQFNAGATVVADKFTIDGTHALAPDGWAKDDAHTPGAFWFSYVTTGEHIWHEKLMQLAAWSQFITNPGTGYSSVANGHSSQAIILNGLQMRAFGWQMRNRGRAYWAALDGSPEKVLLDKSITDAVAMRAGLFDIPGYLVGNTIRDTWNTNHRSWYQGVPNPRPNPLAYLWGRGVYTNAPHGGSLPSDSDGVAQALWMHNFVAMSLNHVCELGRPDISPLANFASMQSILIATSSEPRHIADYTWPDIRNDGMFYQNLDQLYSTYSHDADGAYPNGMPIPYTNGFPGAGAPNTYGVTVELYGSIAAAAIASANTSQNQGAAWATIAPWHNASTYYNHDPRFAIVPRT